MVVAADLALLALGKRCFGTWIKNIKEGVFSSYGGKVINGLSCRFWPCCGGKRHIGGALIIVLSGRCRAP